MNAIHAIDRILTLGLDNMTCGTIMTTDSAIDDCKMNFGDFHAIIEPKPHKVYLYEWKDTESINEIGEPDALLIQPSNDGTMLVYLYELDEN